MKAIIFTGTHGRCAIYGEVEKLPMPEEPVLIKNARMILHVAEVGFVGLASIGPKKGTDTRITAPVPSTICTCKQAEECTEEAAAAIDAWPNWNE
jgi:hypothetical protein